jgi:hypothetical protein
MSSTSKLRTSWELLLSSARVLRANPRLALFPLASSLCALLLAAFFLVPIVIPAAQNGGVRAWLTAHRWNGHELQTLREMLGWTFYSYVVGLYLVSLIVSTFCNVAFYSEIIRALDGHQASLRNGVRLAGSRLRSILMWSLFAGTIGLIIRAVEERLGWIGKWGMGLVGLGWSVAAVFAIPVIVRQEERNPLRVLRHSATTLKRAWGESLVGYMGIRMGGLILVAGVVIGLIALVMAGQMAVLGHFNGRLAASMQLAGLLVIFGAGFLLNLTNAIYRCALYIYASEGVVPASYTVEMMNAGWKVRKTGEK